jgi:hypothetical protein
MGPRSQLIASLVLGLTLAACASPTSFAGGEPMMRPTPSVTSTAESSGIALRLPAVTLAELRAEGLRHTFRLPS